MLKNELDLSRQEAAMARLENLAGDIQRLTAALESERQRANNTSAPVQA